MQTATGTRAHPSASTGLGTPFGCGGNPLSGFPSQPMGPCTSTSVPTAPLPWRGGDGDDNIERDSHLVHTLDGCICIHLYIHLQNPSARSICKIHPSEFVCIAKAISESKSCQRIYTASMARLSSAAVVEWSATGSYTWPVISGVYVTQLRPMYLIRDGMPCEFCCDHVARPYGPV